MRNAKCDQRGCYGLRQSWDSAYGLNYPARNTVFWIGTLGSGSHTIKEDLPATPAATATISNRVLLIYILDGDTFLYLDSSATSTDSNYDLHRRPSSVVHLHALLAPARR